VQILSQSFTPFVRVLWKATFRSIKLWLRNTQSYKFSHRSDHPGSGVIFHGKSEAKV